MKTNEKIILKDDTLDYVSKKRVRPIVGVLLCYTFALMMVLVSFYLFKLGKDVVINETDRIDYSLSGNVDYKVRLKKNDYYKEEYLKSGMQYIASLIDTVDVDFKYEAHASEKVNYKYKYNVSATTLVTSKTDKSKVIFESKEYIIKDEPVELKSNNFVIDKVIPINYGKYNNYIKEYKREYLLNALFDLIINIHVETVGESHISNTPFKEEKDFKIVIPLSEQVIDISKKAPSYEMSGFISGIENKTLKAKLLYGGGIASAIISMALLVLGLIIITLKNRKKSEYCRIIDKYLKEYDRAIVITDQSKINEDDYKQVIEISSMQEMLDLHDNFQLPILYYEIVKNRKSYFVIIKEDILYKLVISKERLVKDSGDK